MMLAANHDSHNEEHPSLFRFSPKQLDNGLTEIYLLAEGIRCNACVVLIEKTLLALPGVKLVEVNAITRRTRIVFNTKKISLSTVLKTLDTIGHKASPLDAKANKEMQLGESRDLLKRLVVAGFGMMQAMMFALVIYLDANQEIANSTLALFRWLGFLVASPVVLYSAQPFFKGAVKGFRGRQVNMDVPIAIAIALIYCASLYQAFQLDAEVYFDSISMLIFFLLSGRYIEMLARHRSIDNTKALAQLTPNFVERLNAEGQFEKISLNSLKKNDIVKVFDSGHLPADGILLSEFAQIDESLLSGEAQLQNKKQGDALVAGSLVIGSAIELKVTQCGENTFLATLAQLANRAQTQKPRLADAGQKAAKYFVTYVLGFSLLSCLLWLIVDPTQALNASLAVLVAACPCAFALAVPAAITRSLSILARRGILVVNADAIENLAHYDIAIFDKTGTLTLPTVRIHKIYNTLSESEVLQIAASLSQESKHPLSKAILNANKKPLLTTKDIYVETGLGLKGYVDNHFYRLGRVDYALPETLESDADLILSDGKNVIASFHVDEQVREDSQATIFTLQNLGIQCEILSGDAKERVANIATSLNIKHWQARQLPADKLAYIQSLQSQGHRVMVVGDGSNDAPFLAGANVSIALASGTDLAHAQADIILCSEHLTILLDARQIAQQTLQILKQNQKWAFAYNLLAIPLAAFGFVPPWLAAIGMSGSSLFVILNALRIGKNQALNASSKEQVLHSPHRLINVEAKS